MELEHENSIITVVVRLDANDCWDLLKSTLKLPDWLHSKYVEDSLNESIRKREKNPYNESESDKKNGQICFWWDNLWTFCNHWITNRNEFDWKIHKYYFNEMRQGNKSVEYVQGKIASQMIK